MKIINFWGDLTDNSAKKEALVAGLWLWERYRMRTRVVAGWIVLAPTREHQRRRKQGSKKRRREQRRRHDPHHFRRLTCATPTPLIPHPGCAAESNVRWLARIHSASSVSREQTQVRASPAVLLFSKLNKTFFGYFHPENVFQDNENK